VNKHILPSQKITKHDISTEEERTKCYQNIGIYTIRALAQWSAWSKLCTWL